MDPLLEACQLLIKQSILKHHLLCNDSGVWLLQRARSRQLTDLIQECKWYKGLLLRDFPSFINFFAFSRRNPQNCSTIVNCKHYLITKLYSLLIKNIASKYIIPVNTNTKKNPAVIARMIAVTVPITEKNPFIPQANAANLRSLSSIRVSPIGNGIPMKKPSGAMIRAEITTLQVSSRRTSDSNITGTKKPRLMARTAMIPNIIYNFFLLFAKNLMENILPIPDAISIVLTTVSSV